MAERTYTVTESTKREIETLLRTARNTLGPGNKQLPWGVAVRQPVVQPRSIARPSAQLLMLKVVSITSPAALGGGKYWGRLQRRIAGTTFAADATHLTMADLFEDANADDLFMYNPLERSGLSTHFLAVNSYQRCIATSEVTDDGYAVYEVVSPGVSTAC